MQISLQFDEFLLTKNLKILISGRIDHLKLVGTSCRFILGEVGLRLFQSSWKLGQKLVGTPCKSYRSNDADCKTRIDQWRKCAKCRLSAKKEARYFVRLLTLKREWHFISTRISIVVGFSIQCNACHCFCRLIRIAYLN